MSDEPEYTEVTVEGLGDMADGLATFEDRPLYVSDVIPGERVRVRIRKRYRRAAVGVLETILEPSPDRVEPPCPLFGTCSGCQMQHISYERQLRIKREMVADALAEVGIDPACLGEPMAAPAPWHYRNHGRFTVQQGTIGFVQRRQKKLFRVDHCHLMDPGINDVLDRLQDQLPEATQCNVRVGTRTGDRMVQPALDVAHLGVASGQKTFTEELGGRRFRVSAPAFFQVNTAQAERLAGVVLNGLQLTGQEVVVDAYAGVGTFAALLAPRARRVIAIEESGPAMDDARHNLADLTNVEIRPGRTEDLLEALIESGERTVDRVILDPPRSGCDPRALAAVKALAPARIAYVSCDPRSLARDLERLRDRFELITVTPVDMFPQTRHVEAVALLRNRPPEP
jgi:23S rRNA (uracil1939-C5)-methyltransferase